MLKGVIINNASNIYCVEVKDIVYECNARGKFKEKKIVPVVGDRVNIEVIDESEKKAVINEILERDNFIKRPKMANLSKLIFVISAKQPKPDLLMLDRQLAFAKYLGIEALIVINKIDLEKEENIQMIKKIYEDIGYKVITTNAKKSEGVDAISSELDSHISAFSGNSGVGKSTLLNAIFRDNITCEGEISDKNKRGKNTTTAIKLYKINDNSYIADTPGFGAFDIYEIKSKDLFRYFKEFVQYEKDCAYVGCTHIKEQECGIKKALKDGKISDSRYNSYVKIYEDLKDKEDHRW